MMKMGKVVLMTVFFVLPALGTASLAQDTFPEGWAGSWHLVEVQKDCDSGVVLGTYDRWVTIWPGDGPADWDASLDFSRETATITADAFDYDGNDTHDELPCTVISHITYTMTRSDETLIGSKRDNHTVLNCAGSYCFKFEITGERNPTPATASTWGFIKALYR
jgi:hypothetical protein